MVGIIQKHQKDDDLGVTGIIDTEPGYKEGAPGVPVKSSATSAATGSATLPDISGGTASGYDPERISLDEKQDTVAGRINSVIAQNSPLMQAGRTRAAQESNKRGILNSTMGVQAGEMAVYESALPIAQQDAATSYDARKTNAGAANTAMAQQTTGQQALEQGAQAGVIQSRLQGQQGQIQSQLQAEKADIDKQLITAEGAVREQLLARQGEIDRELAAQQGQIQSQLQGEQGQIQSQLQAEKAQIDKELLTADGEVRERLLNRQGEIDQELTRLQGEISVANESRLIAERGEIELELQTAESANRLELLTRQGEIDVELARERGDIEGALQAERGVIELQLAEAEGEIREGLISRQGEIDAELQDMRTQGALEVADLEGQWKNVLQTSQSATVFYTSVVQQIGAVLANAKMSPANKNTEVQKLRQILSNGLAMVGTLGNTDLSNIFGSTGSGSSNMAPPAVPYTPGFRGI